MLLRRLSVSKSICPAFVNMAQGQREYQISGVTRSALGALLERRFLFSMLRLDRNWFLLVFWNADWCLVNKQPLEGCRPHTWIWASWSSFTYLQSGCFPAKNIFRIPHGRARLPRWPRMDLLKPGRSRGALALFVELFILLQLVQRVRP